MYINILCFYINEVLMIVSILANNSQAIHNLKLNRTKKSLIKHIHPLLVVKNKDNGQLYYKYLRGEPVINYGPQQKLKN